MKMKFNTKLEEQLFNLGIWNSEKIKYHLKANHNKVKHMRIKFGQVWYCDLGYNIGDEKNKNRPILIVSNNSINNSGKFVGVCITDAQGKISDSNLPNENTWYLLYSNTHDQNKKYKPNRIIPSSAIQYYFLEKDSVVQCEEIRSLSKARLSRYMGRLHDNDLNFIKIKLKNVFKIL